MQKIGIIVGILTFLIIGGGAFLLTRSQVPMEPSSYDPKAHLYFWGNGCPHCKIVDDFVNNWENRDKLNIQKFEVWYNKSNAALLKQKAIDICKISDKEITVPLLITPEGKCFNGDQSIIDYYKGLRL